MSRDFLKNLLLANSGQIGDLSFMNLFRWPWVRLTRPAALVAWLGNGAKPVPQAEAERRSRVCENCPANLRPSSFTAVLGNGVEEIVRLKNKMKLSVSIAHRLNTCAACGCKLSVKIWVPYHHIKAYQKTDETNALRDANSNCWQL